MTIIKTLGHPLAQLISFCILMINSPYFGGPFLFFIYHSSIELYTYGIIGLLGIIVTIVAIFYQRKAIQLTGLALMIISLFIFFAGGNLQNLATFHFILPIITFLLFIGVIIAVSLKYFKFT